MYCICVCLCVIVGFQFGLKFVLSDSINKFVLSRYVLTSIVQNVEGWSPSCYKKSQNRLDDALPFKPCKNHPRGDIFFKIFPLLVNWSCHWTGFGKMCHDLGILNITFKYRLEIIFPIFGWYSIRTFTSPCWIQLLYSYLYIIICLLLLECYWFPYSTHCGEMCIIIFHRISTNDSSSYCHLVVFKIIVGYSTYWHLLAVISIIFAQYKHIIAIFRYRLSLLMFNTHKILSMYIYI